MMEWRGRRLTFRDAEELYRMYRDIDYYAPEGSLARDFWMSIDTCDEIKGFLKYVRGDL